MKGLLLALGAYLLLSLFILPVQYKYIKALKEMDKERMKLGLSQNEYYEKMGFEREQLHFNAQGNLLFVGANMLATFLYNWRQKIKCN